MANIQNQIVWSAFSMICLVMVFSNLLNALRVFKIWIFYEKYGEIKHKKSLLTIIAIITTIIIVIVKVDL